MFKQNSQSTSLDTDALICPICKKVGGEQSASRGFKLADLVLFRVQLGFTLIATLKNNIVLKVAQ